MYEIVVYEKTKTVCMPCRFTKRELDKHKYGYKKEPLEELTAEQLEVFKLAGMYSAPIVQIVASNGVILDQWAGHNVNKLKEYIKED